MSPTQRSLALLRDQGYLVAVVEKWNPHAKIRQDLFGFIDLLAVKDGEVLGVQSTSYSNTSARLKKIREHENLSQVLASGMRVVVHGWRKVGARWEFRNVEVEK